MCMYVGAVPADSERAWRHSHQTTRARAVTEVQSETRASERDDQYRGHGVGHL